MIRVTAREALANLYMTAPNVFEQKEADKNREVSKLVKVLVARGHSIKTAAPIAKRAYRLGVRVN